MDSIGVETGSLQDMERSIDDSEGDFVGDDTALYGGEKQEGLEVEAIDCRKVFGTR